MHIFICTAEIVAMSASGMGIKPAAAEAAAYLLTILAARSNLGSSALLEFVHGLF